MPKTKLVEAYGGQQYYVGPEAPDEIDKPWIEADEDGRNPKGWRRFESGKWVEINQGKAIEMFEKQKADISGDKVR